MDSRNVKPNLLAQLEIDGQSRRRPFNKLPNELLRAILRRVQAHHLIRLRLVDMRWRAQIEDIWKDKKCLMIGQRWDKYCLSNLSAPMNGQLKLTTDFVFIQLKYNRHDYQMELSGHLCTLLPKLFPNIEQFYIIESVEFPSTDFTSMLSQWSSTLSTLSLFNLLNQNQNFNDFYAQLNQMINLKRLDLALFPSIKELAPTFGRLEHFSTSSTQDIDEIVTFFGEGFCSLGLKLCNCVNIQIISNWSRLNAQFVRNLVRLSLSTSDPQVLSFICEHFSSLQMLRIYVGRQFTTEMIANLPRLTHLAELRIYGTYIDLGTLDVTKLKPLLNIRTFSLVDFTFVNGARVSRNYDVPQFSRILSTILPNVTKLTVKSLTHPEIGNLFEAHLNRFVHLRSFNVELDSSIGRLMN